MALKVVVPNQLMRNEAIVERLEAEGCEIDFPGIGTGAGHNHFRLVRQGQASDLRVIDSAGIFPNAIVNKAKKSS